MLFSVCDCGRIIVFVLLPIADGTNMDQKFLLLILPSERFMCGRCQRFTAEKSDELCQRCHNVLAEGWDL